MATSNTISPETWEEMRDQISDLYRNDEWPLKQVIKKLRTDKFNPSETQLRSKLKKWRVTKTSRRNNKKPAVETSTNDSKSTSFEEGKADSSAPPAAAEHPLPNHDPQSANTEWTNSDIYASPTKFQPSVPPTPYNWAPDTVWQESTFAHDRGPGELYQNQAAAVVRNDCNSAPSLIHGAHPPMLLPYSSAASTWSSLEAPLHPSSNLMQQPNVITPPNLWLSPTTGQSLSDSYAQQGNPLNNAYSQQTQPLNNAYSQHAQPLDNTYSQQAQPSPTASQYPGTFHGPSDPTVWSEESLQELKQQHAQWRRSFDASQGSMETSRVKREPRFRIHPEPKPTTFEYGDASQRVNAYDSSYHPNPPGQRPHLSPPDRLISGWHEVNGAQPGEHQSQSHFDLHHSNSVYS